MDCIKALEEERKKILLFERELPLSLQLITQAIENCKKQQGMAKSEEINSVVPILEEFIPLRPSCSSSDEENNRENGWSSDCFDKKPDWLKSVQLWNKQPEHKGDIVRKPIAVNAKKTGGAFHPFEKEKFEVKAPTAAPASSTTENTNDDGRSGGYGEEKEKEGPSQRKARRCWMPELHRRFLHALQQLGGCHVATPKQIRELMKVNGLTNDEVKSHLQKYRLHTKKPTVPTFHNDGNNSQQPQHLLVGGMWMPPPNYTTVSEAVPSNNVYAPVASLSSEFCPQRHLKQGTDRSPERDDDNVEDSERMKSHSSNTSSQTTASLPFYV